MLNGVFCDMRPAHVHFMAEAEADAFSRLARCNFDNMHEVILNRELRFRLIADLEQYYRLHIPDFRGLNSLSVFHELFD